MVKTPEGIVVEREQGYGQIGEEAEAVAGGRAADGSTAHTFDAGNADAETTRRARFLEALDAIMKDHHNVLAALAK